MQKWFLYLLLELQVDFQSKHVVFCLLYFYCTLAISALHGVSIAFIYDDDAPVVANGLPASSLQPRRGRGQGAEILRAQSMDIPPGWSINASSFVAQPLECPAVGPKEILSSINAGSSPQAFFCCSGMMLCGKSWSIKRIGRLSM